MVSLNIISEVSQLWNSNNNCAQATGQGLLNYFDYTKEGRVLSASFIPYGGGFKEGSVCGAVTGTLAAMSFILSQEIQDDDQIIAMTNQMKTEFLHEFSSIQCDILLEGISDDASMDGRRFCTTLVNFAARSAKDILQKQLEIDNP